MKGITHHLDKRNSSSLSKVSNFFNTYHPTSTFTTVQIGREKISMSLTENIFYYFMIVNVIFKCNFDLVCN